MTEIEKVFYPTEIPDVPFPQQVTMDDSISQSTSNGVQTNATTKEQSFPDKRISYEVLSSALNTKSKKILQEFQFTPSGALQIGQYEQGVSGDVRISPNGITARNNAGNTTFDLDGDTGDATFAGSIQAGSVITGLVDVGNGNVVIDGANARILINDGSNNRVAIGNL